MEPKATEKIGAINVISIKFTRLPLVVFVFDARIQIVNKKNRLNIEPRINITFVHDLTVTKRSGVMPKKKKRVLSKNFEFNSGM